MALTNEELKAAKTVLYQAKAAALDLNKQIEQVQAQIKDAKAAGN